MTQHDEAPAAAVIRRLIEASNDSDIETYIGLHAPDFHNFGRPSGPDGMRRIYESIHMAFPDWSSTIDEIITDGTGVACRLTATGTHRGTPELEAIFGGVLVGIEPTGRRVAVPQIHMYEVVDNLITSHWAVRDDLAMLRQLTGD